MSSAKLENLEELRTLTAVISSGSIAGASEELGLAARTVGRRLAALEERLGETLVHRTTRSLRPTVSAIRLAEDCREAIRLLELAEDRFDGQRGEIRGVVRISLPSLFAGDVLEATKATLQEYSELRLEFEVRDGPVRDLSDQGLDIAIVAERPTRGHDMVQRIGTLHSVLAAASVYLAERGRPEKPEELGSHDCLCFARQETWTLLKGRKRVEVPVSGRISSTDSRLLRSALLGGFGIGPVSPSWLRSPGCGAVAVLPDWHWPTIEMWMLTSRSTHELSRVKLAQGLIRGAF